MANAVGGLGDALRAVGGNVKKAVKGEVIHHSNDAISKIGAGVLNNGLGGAQVAYNVLKKNQGIKEAAAEVFKNGDKLNYGKIAGSYIGMSAAARVATGGGLYKDRNGSTNIAGIPFI